jgi:hypothetical protein
MRRHAQLLVDFFGPVNGVLQMRKWCGWYLTGFRNSAALRARLSRMASLDELDGALRDVDPDEPFPMHTVRGNRVKDGRVQRRVALPEGFLVNRLVDDTPPSGPRDPAARAAWERALDGG